MMSSDKASELRIASKTCHGENASSGIDLVPRYFYEERTGAQN